VRATPCFPQTITKVVANSMTGIGVVDGPPVVMASDSNATDNYQTDGPNPDQAPANPNEDEDESQEKSSGISPRSEDEKKDEDRDDDNEERTASSMLSCNICFALADQPVIVCVSHSLSFPH
jgi:hypothetical protein